MKPTTIVRQAIENTKRERPEHWKQCLVQRAGINPGHLGSFYEYLSESAVDHLIEQLIWEPYTHSDVMPGCQAYIAPASGLFGLMPLGDLPEDAELQWDDGKNTGMVELVWRAHGGQFMKVDFTTLIVGPLDASQPIDIVYTFHPGDPIRPSRIHRKFSDTGDRHGMKIDKASAARHGVRWVKLGPA